MDVPKETVEGFMALQGEIASKIRGYLGELQKHIDKERWPDQIERALENFTGDFEGIAHPDSINIYRYFSTVMACTTPGHIRDDKSATMERLRRIVPASQQEMLRGIQQLEKSLPGVQDLDQGTFATYEGMLGGNEASFFTHDAHHQYDDIGILVMRVTRKRGFEGDRKQGGRLLSHIFSNAEVGLGGSAYMRDQAGFLAAQTHGIEPHREELDLVQMVRTVSLLVAARGSLYGHSFGVQGSRDNVVGQNMVKYHIDPVHVVANPGAIYAILYNYAKNSMKKLDGELREGMHEEGATLGIAIEDISPEYFMITETDSGDPVCLDGFLNAIRERLNASEEWQLDNLRQFSPRSASVLERWTDGQPFAIHELSVEDLTELVHVGGITGIGQNYHSGSGTGLLAVRYIAEAHNGKVLYTQSGVTGGPIFGVLLPKDLTKSSPADLDEALGLAKERTSYHVERMVA